MVVFCPPLHGKLVPLKHPFFCLIPKPRSSRTNEEFVWPLLNRTHQTKCPLWVAIKPTPTSVWVLFLRVLRALLSRTRTPENASDGPIYLDSQPIIWPDMVLKVGNSTPQFGAKTSVKSSSGGSQVKVFLMVQLPLHSCAYCKAMHPRPGLAFSWGSFWAVRFLLIISTSSFAGFPVRQTLWWCKPYYVVHMKVLSGWVWKSPWVVWTGSSLVEAVVALVALIMGLHGDTYGWSESFILKSLSSRLLM